ncbi:predicted protein [Lichtheimia corymbifera JMRC:FSU:9682]|uniref:Uncharacterized protein n=1 Tax=Lichtheimia corymbifera JMRC:FSU:9682 TaxID=1263082 RepID=A0A068S741_9FUNG|nr:predicted protein [Lichtheimia corymbifera JMRC:FSU:9682]
MDLSAFITWTQCSKVLDHFIISVHHDNNSHALDYINKAFQQHQSRKSPTPLSHHEEIPALHNKLSELSQTVMAHQQEIINMRFFAQQLDKQRFMNSFTLDALLSRTIAQKMLWRFAQVMRTILILQTPARPQGTPGVHKAAPHDDLKRHQDQSARMLNGAAFVIMTSALAISARCLLRAL